MKLNLHECALLWDCVRCAIADSRGESYYLKGDGDEDARQRFRAACRRMEKKISREMLTEYARKEARKKTQSKIDQ